MKYVLYVFYNFSDKRKNVCFENLYPNYHNKDNINILNRQKFKNEFKQKVEDDIYERPSKLLYKELA